MESYQDEEDTERFVAQIVNKDQCIGCQVCGRACVRGCLSFSLS